MKAVEDTPRPAAPASTPWHAREVALAVGLLLAAAALRLRGAAATTLWTDEIMTLWMARRPLPDLFRVVAEDVHPPLHFLLVHAWRALGGESSLWIKSLSVIFGVGLVGLVMRAGVAMFGRRAGWIGAALLTIHGAHIYVSQESRFYALLWLWLAGAAWAGWHWVTHGGRGAAAWLVLCLVGGMYTHYLSLVVYGFLALWGVVVLRDRPRELARWFGLFALAGLAFAPQLPVFAAQVTANRTAHWVRVPELSDLVGLARRLSFLAIYLAPFVFGLCVLPLLRRDMRGAASLLWTLILGPTLLTFTLTHAGLHVFTERYMLYATTFVCMLAGSGLAGIPTIETRPLRRARAVLIALLLAAGVRLALVRPSFPEAAAQDAAARWLESQVTPGDTIWHADIHSLFFLRHHHPDLGVQRLVWWTDEVPYYEGGRLIPRDWIVPAAAFDRLARAGGHWWGMNTEQGGTSAVPTRHLLDARGVRVGSPGREVTLWRARPVARRGAP